MPPSEFDALTPVELGEVFAGFGWRTNRLAITTAYYTAALTVGAKDLPSLADLLSDEPAAGQPSAEEYHRRMREMGWE